MLNPEKKFDLSKKQMRHFWKSASVLTCPPNRDMTDLEDEDKELIIGIMRAFVPEDKGLTRDEALLIAETKEQFDVLTTALSDNDQLLSGTIELLKARLLRIKIDFDYVESDGVLICGLETPNRKGKFKQSTDICIIELEPTMQ